MTGVTIGQIHVSEVSGATMLQGDRLLLVSDEPDGNGGHDVFVLAGASGQLLTTDVHPEALDLSVFDIGEGWDDLEDATFDLAGKRAYLVTSHSQNRTGKDKRTRRRIARLTFGDEGRVTAVDVSDRLQTALDTIADLVAARKVTPAQAGLNVEGLCLFKDHLWVGLRSPTHTFDKKRETPDRRKLPQEDARILKFTPADLFDGGAVPPPSVPLTLNLAGQGVRGMTVDPSGQALLIVAGLSPDPNEDVDAPWSIWSWDGTAAEPRLLSLPIDPAPVGNSQWSALRALTEPPFGTPEAICALEVGGVPQLLLVEDRQGPTSRYLLVPTK